MTGYMPPLHMPLEPKWRHYPTYVYDQNYAYGMNYYQPMLDYAEKKNPRNYWPFTERRYERKTELPHLPWSDGRLVWEERPVYLYDRHDLVRRAVDAEDEARDHLSQFKIAKRSDFSLTKTVHASRVTKDIFPRTGSDLRRRPAVITPSQRNKVLTDPEEMAEIKMQALMELQRLSDIQDALDHGKRLRGKSARSIEFQLRSEAMRNLTKSEELADIRRVQRESVRSMRSERDHSRLMEERTKCLLDEDKIAEPLDELSKELRGYEQKSSSYFLDKRYRDPYRRDGLLNYRGPGCMSIGSLSRK